MPIAITRRSPNRSTRRPAGSAPTTRISANALITLAAAADADAELAGERRDGRRDDPVAERDGERDRGQYRHLPRQPAERATWQGRHRPYSVAYQVAGARFFRRGQPGGANPPMAPLPVLGCGAGAPAHRARPSRARSKTDWTATRPGPSRVSHDVLAWQRAELNQYAPCGYSKCRNIRTDWSFQISAPGWTRIRSPGRQVTDERVARGVQQQQAVAAVWRRTCPSSGPAGSATPRRPRPGW